MNSRLSILAFLAALLAPSCLPVEPATISLPSPKKMGGVSVETALVARRSIRAYTKQRLTMADLGQLLWAAQGVTSPDGKRAAPSAMHRYPLEVAVVAQNVEGLPNGQVHSAPAVFVIAAVYERMGSGAKNHTWTDYEAGLASENLMLEAVALGLGSVMTGGIDAGAVKDAVKFTAGEQVIIVIPVGHPAK